MKIKSRNKAKKKKIIKLWGKNLFKCYISMSYVNIVWWNKSIGKCKRWEWWGKMKICGLRFAEIPLFFFFWWITNTN